MVTLSAPFESSVIKFEAEVVSTATNEPINKTASEKGIINFLTVFFIVISPLQIHILEIVKC